MQLFGFIIHCKMHSDMHNSAWDATIDLPPTHQKKKSNNKNNNNNKYNSNYTFNKNYSNNYK